MRYWAEEMHVDGFRFDLGGVAGPRNQRVGSNATGSGFLDAVRQDPVLSKLKLIAEPWDLGDATAIGSGGFPPGWSASGTTRRYRDDRTPPSGRRDQGMAPRLIAAPSRPRA